MGVLRVENGKLRFTGYGMFRLVMPLLGIFGFLVWHFWTGVHARREFREFQQSAATLERDLRQCLDDVDGRADAARTALLHWGPSDPQAPNYLIDDIRTKLDEKRYASIAATDREPPMVFDDSADAAAWESLQRSVDRLSQARLEVRRAVDAIVERVGRIEQGHLSDEEERLLRALSDDGNHARHALDWHENHDVLIANLESTSWDRVRAGIEPLCRALAAIRPRPNL